MAPAPLTAAGERVVSLTWGWDYLANQTEWTDDQSSFYERSLGGIVNGDAESSALRPSAIYLATNLDGGTGAQSGWAEVDYGVGGNMVSMTVHSRCTDVTAGSCVVPASGDLDARRLALNDGCACDNEQHYVYRWDELDRLTEARRYDRVSPGGWTLEVRQRYRYDGANQRTVKQTLAQDGCVTPPTAGTPCERVALYVYPGDFERRGLLTGVGTYDADATLGTETQYVIAGARTVFRASATAPLDAYERDERLVVPLTDLIGTTSAAFDVRTGRLVEASTYYPNGARETFLGTTEAAADPSGFTGKEGDEEVGLIYFGERYLVPRLGRWATPDPLHVHASGGGEALNSYHYVGGNLLAARDPLGLDVIGLHGGGPGSPESPTRIANLARDLVAGPNSDLRVVLPHISYDNRSGNITPDFLDFLRIKDDPWRGVEYAEQHIHSREQRRISGATSSTMAPPDPGRMQPRALAGYSLGADAALQAGGPQGGGRWDLRVVVGAEVGDDFVSQLEQAAATSERVIVVGIRGDDYMAHDNEYYRALFGPSVGRRSYESIVRSVEQAYGSLDEFYRQHPNVALSRAEPTRHAGGAATDSVDTAIRQGWQELEGRESHVASADPPEAQFQEAPTE